MTNPPTKSLRRKIVTTFIWTLVLLLLTNVGWSVCFGLSNKHNDIGGQEIGRDVTPVSRDILVYIWYTKRVYTVVEPLDPSWADAVTGTFGDVAPSWLEQHYLSYRHTELQSEAEVRLKYGVVGWPAPMLWTAAVWKWHAIADSGRYMTIPTTGVNIGRVNGVNWGQDVVFPFRPLLAGQAFYFVFWLAVVCAFPIARRRFRARRFRCGICNYNLRGNKTGVCPECGGSVGEIGWVEQPTWLRGRRIGNYQLTIGQDAILICHMIPTWPGAVFAAGLAWPVILLVTVGFVEYSKHPFDSFFQSVPTSVLELLVLFGPLLLSAIPLLRNSRKIRNNTLRRMGFPICVKCEYDLKGFTEIESVGRCPECGAVIADMPPVTTTEH